MRQVQDTYKAYKVDTRGMGWYETPTRGMRWV